MFRGPENVVPSPGSCATAFIDRSRNLSQVIHLMRVNDAFVMMSSMRVELCSSGMLSTQPATAQLLRMRDFGASPTFFVEPLGDSTWTWWP